MAYPRVQEYSGGGWHIKYCRTMDEARKVAISWGGANIFRGTELLGYVSVSGNEARWKPWKMVSKNRYEFVYGTPINKDGTLRK